MERAYIHFTIPFTIPFSCTTHSTRLDIVRHVCNAVNITAYVRLGEFFGI